MKKGNLKSTWRCGVIVALTLVAAFAASTQPHSSGAIDKSLGAKEFTVTLHLLVNKPTLIQSHFTNVSVDYKPTASETTVKQGVANTQTLNRELIEGVNKHFAQAAQRYGAEAQQGIARLPSFFSVFLTLARSSLKCSSTWRPRSDGADDVGMQSQRTERA
jgi:hypothetical protein